MKLKKRLDMMFFLTEEEVEEGYVVHESNYWWAFLCIVFGLFAMFIALQAIVFLSLVD